MSLEDNQIYFDKIDEVGDKVYEFYKMADRKDLIMVYEMISGRIYSYIYEDYKNSLNERSRNILSKQYEEALESGKIVLFIRDEVRRKFKSFTI